MPKCDRPTIKQEGSSPYKRPSSSSSSPYKRRSSSSSSIYNRASGGSSPYKRSSPAKPSQPKVYRLNFGKHAGKTLAECPEGYTEWLVRDKVGKDRPDLQKALEKHVSESFYPELLSSVHAQLYNNATSPSSSSASSGTIYNSSPTPKSPVKRQVRRGPYVFDFGTHVGKTLAEVPKTYIIWLLQQQILHDNLELKQAMLEEGFIDQTKDPLQTYRIDKWEAPGVHKAPVHFYNRETDEYLWIQPLDISKFFHMDEKFIRGLPLVDDSKEKKYFLYHIYELAKRFGDPDLADVGLDDWFSWKGSLDDEAIAALGVGLSRAKMAELQSKRR